jgi:predicted GH43/DUF377 family glycosyl hydrolase
MKKAVWTYLALFSFNAFFIVHGTSFALTAVTVRVDDGSYSYVSYYCPLDGQWFNDTWTQCHANTRHYTKTPGAYAQFTFTGSSVQWIGEVDATRGLAEIYIDDVLDTMVDTYAPQLAFQQVLYQREGLKAGRHVLRIVCKGTKSPQSTDTYIDIDAIEYVGDSLLQPVGTYSDGRPAPLYRMDAEDQGVILRYGQGPDQCDSRGMREAIINQVDDTFYLYYDGAGPNGWLACLATSPDLNNWTLHGARLDLGSPGTADASSASSPWLCFDGDEWHMFYLGTPNASPAPDYIPAFPYLTMKAKSSSVSGPWAKQYDLTPFVPVAETWNSATASPGHIVKYHDQYLQFFSGSGNFNGSLKRTIGIARTGDPDSTWTIDSLPAVPSEEQIENSSLYYEESNQTWFLFTNHIGLDGFEYTDAAWVYWTRDLNKWNPADKAVVLDKKNCIWSANIIGMPTVTRVGNRLAIFYDGREDPDDRGHMFRSIGLAWLDLPLIPPTILATGALPQRPLPAVNRKQASLFRIVGDHWTIPDDLAHAYRYARIYDLAGRLIATVGVEKGRIRFNDARFVRIVRLVTRR